MKKVVYHMVQIQLEVNCGFRGVVISDVVVDTEVG